MTRIDGYGCKMVPELVDTTDERLCLKFIAEEDHPINIFISQNDAGTLFMLLASFFSGQNRIVKPCDVDSFQELTH